MSERRTQALEVPWPSQPSARLTFCSWLRESDKEASSWATSSRKAALAPASNTAGDRTGLLDLDTFTLFLLDSLAHHSPLHTSTLAHHTLQFCSIPSFSFSTPGSRKKRSRRRATRKGATQENVAGLGCWPRCWWLWTSPEGTPFGGLKRHQIFPLVLMGRDPHFSTHPLLYLSSGNGCGDCLHVVPLRGRHSESFACHNLVSQAKIPSWSAWPSADLPAGGEGEV